VIRCLLWCLVLLAGPVQAGVGPVPVSGRIEILFAPDDPVEARLIELIGQARHSVHVQMYAFTRKAIAEALVAAHARGVKVEVLADAGQNQRGKNALPILLAAGVPVSLETAYRAAHNKIMLIDVASQNNVVVTGSYNFSWSAGAKNAENVVILHADRAVADAYRTQWQRHAAAATRIWRLPQRLVD
jgi:phosphatidylserine/phosphatidylglycerophosphate/cardiolipin synthase-like enzyme